MNSATSTKDSAAAALDLVHVTDRLQEPRDFDHVAPLKDDDVSERALDPGEERD
jgi:hypothetical protein